jgi:predicted alpha/beta-fold hydrolase
MPLISHSTYTGPPKYYLNGHIETVIPSLFRKIEGIKYLRERIHTPDGDFLDLDWSRVGGDALILISHGLEGSSDRHYAKGLVKLFNSKQMDAMVWNNRSCSGEINLLPILYHHGASDDLKTVIAHVLKNNDYQSVFLAGVSMGGAQTLKYLGEEAADVPEAIKGAAVYSTPCNLPSSASTLGFKINSFYKNRFLKKLKKKLILKAGQYPGLIDLDRLGRVHGFEEFDTYFTAPLHGFKDAEDFYRSVSADNWMHLITVPTLIINALNDPLLGKACYPVRLAEGHEHIYLEMPKRGGHTGFTLGSEFTWAEYRLFQFCADLLNL